MRENGSLLSRVVDPPGTKGGPRAGNFSRPAQKHLLSRVKPPPGTKGPFVPGRWFTRDKKGGLLSRVVASPGTKGPHHIYVCVLFLFSQYLVSWSPLLLRRRVRHLRCSSAAASAIADRPDHRNGRRTPSRRRLAATPPAGTPRRRRRAVVLVPDVVWAGRRPFLFFFYYRIIYIYYLFLLVNINYNLIIEIFLLNLIKV